MSNQIIPQTLHCRCWSTKHPHLLWAVAFSLFSLHALLPPGISPPPETKVILQKWKSDNSSLAFNLSFAFHHTPRIKSKVFNLVYKGTCACLLLSLIYLLPVVPPKTHCLLYTHKVLMLLQEVLSYHRVFTLTLISSRKSTLHLLMWLTPSSSVHCSNIIPSEKNFSSTLFHPQASHLLLVDLVILHPLFYLLCSTYYIMYLSWWSSSLFHSLKCKIYWKLFHHRLPCLLWSHFITGHIGLFKN